MITGLEEAEKDLTVFKPMMIKTIEQAYQFVMEVKTCTIFPSDKVGFTSLWEHVDLPEKQPGEKGWERR